MRERGTELKLKSKTQFLVQFQVKMMMVKLQVGYSLIDRSQPLSQDGGFQLYLV